MSLRELRTDMRAAYNLTFIILIVILLVSASSVVILAYQGGQGSQSSPLEKAKWGDTVKVDYIGKLRDGRVFDTSLWGVASNDALYPKSLSFSLRNQSAYFPLEFRIGTGQMIRGFENGILGMAVGETKVLTIAPKDGYGQLNESKLLTIPLVEEMPVFETLNTSAFVSEFSVTPVVGLSLKDPKWGWDLTVIEVSMRADRVVIANSPVLGESYKVFGDPEGSSPTGWYAEVEYFDSSANGGAGLIMVRHHLTPSDAGYFEGVDQAGQTFIVHEVDESSGTVVLNYNLEVVGKTLYFTVTLVAIV
ncbi:MAG: FKBP-type peptidyl-prolyl cis-trans isomerase [Euryarchaeota archaeon]|nr:FKBP-type peptidyl-prolyl cis-trans isomerase [Euryarchaeota archaeon]